MWKAPGFALVTDGAFRPDGTLLSISYQYQSVSEMERPDATGLVVSAALLGCFEGAGKRIAQREIPNPNIQIPNRKSEFENTIIPRWDLVVGIWDFPAPTDLRVVSIA